ncbi:MAG: DUF2865 domain-containing protein [Xanthobacteraceae bacterium]
MMHLGHRGLGAMIVAIAAVVSGSALAQNYSPAPLNPVCGRLEGQLALINRGGDPGQAEQARRYEEQLNQQQADLDRLVAHSRRLGCEGGFFSLFTQQPAQCRPVGARIQELRGAINRTQMEIQRLQGGNLESQRQAVIAALAQNNCGQQYQAAANQQRGFFGGLFGGFNPVLPAPDGYLSSTYRTLCVRTCDGFYFPISFQTTPAHFAEDEQTCQRLCPATEVQLYSHRNPGEEIRQAVSTSGRLYRDLPTAFKYRTSLDATCTCRRPGQSWADALGAYGDPTMQRGDILVTDDRSKAMAQPRSGAQVPPAKPEVSKAAPAASGVTAGQSVAPATADVPTGQIRTVGPPFVPAQ